MKGKRKEIRRRGPETQVHAAVMIVIAAKYSISSLLGERASRYEWDTSSVPLRWSFVVPDN